MENSLTVTIPKFEKGWSNGKEVVLYDLHLTFDDTTWILKKRFNEFYELNEKLKLSHASLPALPEKSFFTLSKPEDLDKRREGLQQYMKSLADRTGLYADKSFLSFVELEEHKPESALNRLEPAWQATHVLMGFRDVLFDAGLRGYFAACADHSAVSRIDSYFANFSFPWDKPKDQEKVSLAVGSIEYWAKPADEENYAYEKVWLKHLKSQAICLAFSSQLKLLAVGCDDGTLVILKLSDENPSKYSEMFCKDIHQSRIMRLIFDEKHEVLYSLSEDKNIFILNLKTKEKTFELAVSVQKPTTMEVDLRYRVAYVADRAGNIGVVTLATNPPTFKQCVKVFPGSSIRALFTDFTTGCLIAADFEHGTISEYRILDPSDPETKIELVRSLPGHPGPRVIRKCMKTGDIFIGHSEGVISVSNPKLSEKGPIFSQRVHEGNINQLQLIKDGRLLVSAGADKILKVGFFYLDVEHSPILDQIPRKSHYK